MVENLDRIAERPWDASPTHDLQGLVRDLNIDPIREVRHPESAGAK